MLVTKQLPETDNSQVIAELDKAKSLLDDSVRLDWRDSLPHSVAAYFANFWFSNYLNLYFCIFSKFSSCISFCCSSIYSCSPIKGETYRANLELHSQSDLPISVFSCSRIMNNLSIILLHSISLEWPRAKSLSITNAHLIF